MTDSLQVVKLHDFPQLFNDCALLLNEEWPRSLTARLHSLEKSCDSLPLSLILINNENRVLGHIRVKKELTQSSDAFIESLVVEKTQRGKGYGKYIMKEIEILVKQMGFKRMTLTTTNQIGFYKSLGFVFNQISDTNQIKCLKNNENSVKNSCNQPNRSESGTPVSPPPPPPLPPLSSPSNNQLLPKVFMFKDICFNKNPIL